MNLQRVRNKRNKRNAKRASYRVYPGDRVFKDEGQGKQYQMLLKVFIRLTTKNMFLRPNDRWSQLQNRMRDGFSNRGQKQSE